MARYAHFHLKLSIFWCCAAIATGAVTFGVRGLPENAERVWPECLILVGWYALIALGQCTRFRLLGSEKADFERALPLADPDAVLPAPKSVVRPAHAAGLALLTAGLVAMSLAWTSWTCLITLMLLPDPIVRAVHTTYWERRHGVYLWQGQVKEQPLGTGQFFYSTPRTPTTT
ncbi:hypothetical protein ABZ883_09150 [Streptomyces sp. NPDC046977]|uniref:hypothetical protein n=1 Tax=Streptomyces sp. NPDC046977 TaxID=3154703 RepID=UPI0033D9DDAC